MEEVTFGNEHNQLHEVLKYSQQIDLKVGILESQPLSCEILQS